MNSLAPFELTPDKISTHEERLHKLQTVLSFLGGQLVQRPSNTALASLYRRVADLLNAAEGSQR